MVTQLNPAQLAAGLLFPPSLLLESGIIPTAGGITQQVGVIFQRGLVVGLGLLFVIAGLAFVVSGSKAGAVVGSGVTKLAEGAA